MKPPRLPGTEKFRFCDQKYREHKAHPREQDVPDSGAVCEERLERKDSLLFDLEARSLSNESVELCTWADFQNENEKQSLLSSDTSCTLEQLISNTNLPSSRPERTKRKPSLPISSRLTSRVFTLTNYIAHLDESENIYYTSKPTGVLEQRDHATADSLLTHLSRNRFPEGFICSPLRPCTPLSMNTETPTSELDAKCRLHSGGSLLHGNTSLMINCTSHASLMSDESLTSLSSAHRTECEDSYRSFSSSPVDHWAKCAVNQSRLSTSSQSSWEDGSRSPEVT